MKNKDLTPRARQIAELVFDNPDLTYTQVAKQIGISPCRISAVMRSDRVLATFPLLARKRLKGMVPQAVSTMDRLMRQRKNLEVSRKVSESVLNTEKVLEPAPVIAINFLQGLSDDELQRKLADSRSLPNASIDAEVVE